MKVFNNCKKPVPFSEIENAECFPFDDHLWFKTTIFWVMHIQGSSNAISLEDCYTRFFPSDCYVTKVGAQVTME
jgi:hypothetical protein